MLFKQITYEAVALARGLLRAGALIWQPFPSDCAASPPGRLDSTGVERISQLILTQVALDIQTVSVTNLYFLEDGGSFSLAPLVRDDNCPEIFKHGL